MADYFGNQKLCATCVYWAGPRSLNTTATQVTNCANDGRCTANKCIIKTTMANQCACFDWKKWPALR